jgi:hypothetical protein
VTDYRRVSSNLTRDDGRSSGAKKVGHRTTAATTKLDGGWLVVGGEPFSEEERMNNKKLGIASFN